MGQGCCKPPPSEQWVGTWVAYNRNGRVSTLIIWPSGCYSVTDIGPCSVSRRECCTCYWRSDAFGCDESCSGFKVTSVEFEPEGSQRRSRAVLNGTEYIRIGPVPHVPQTPSIHAHQAPANVPPTAQYMDSPHNLTPLVAAEGPSKAEYGAVAYPKI